MDDPQEPSSDEQSATTRREAAERARRRARVFGDVLPGETRDDRPSPASTGEDPAGDPGEEWLRSNVPPHHG